MNFIYRLLKRIGMNLAEEILLMNDYVRLENAALIKLIKDKGISTRELDSYYKAELSKRARRMKPVTRKFAINIASPRTVVYNWFKKEAGKIYDSSNKRSERLVGRPLTSKELTDLVLRIVKEQHIRTLRTIEGELENLGYKISHETIRSILKKAGIPPTQDRLNTESWFDLCNKTGVWQMDFTTTHIAVENEKGMTQILRCQILLLIHVCTRKVICAGISEKPDGEWVINAIRSHLGFDLEGVKAIIMDNDPLFHPLRTWLKSVGVTVRAIPPKSPNLNAYIERFHWTLKSECLQWTFPTSVQQLRFIVKEYLNYYNHWRPHQSLNKLPPEPDERIIQARNGELKGKVITESRLGGLIQFRYREAS